MERGTDSFPSVQPARNFPTVAMKSAFIGFDERLALINEVIKPGYAALMA